MFSVKWSPSAAIDFAELVFLHQDLWAEIDDAGDDLDEKLHHDPATHGQHLSEGLWRIISEPLAFYYSIQVRVRSMAVLETENVAELIQHLGVPPERIRMRPLPGTATEEDVIMTRPLCELIDGVLVEKAMGFWESRLAVVLGYFVETFLTDNDIGFTLGEGGMQRLEYGQVRIPDLSFYLWVRFPNRQLLTREQILDKVAELCVEVLSPSNTKKEMERKRREYFAAGARLVWYVDPIKRTVEVFTSADNSTVLDEEHVLDGGDVLPGFKLSIKDWFARAGHGSKGST